MTNRTPRILVNVVMLALLSSCGGGGGGSSGAAPAASGLTKVSSVTTVALAASTVIEDGTRIGAPNPAWGDGSTASGGQGKSVDGLACGAAGTNYSYVHLNIFQNGKLLSLPADIGVVAPSDSLQRGCVYPAHTRDNTGKIRIDTGFGMTLGQFFDIWGQPLSASNVAGIADKPIKVYTNDGGNIAEYTGDPASLPLAPHREITIVAGTAMSQIPTYSWQDPPPLSQAPITLWLDNVIGAATWADGDTASGGQGSATADGIQCEPNMSDNYHVHMHLTLIKDGQMLAVPANIGLPGPCYYDTHTHDATGVIHIEAPSYKPFKLGNFFSVWGMPLTVSNVAGLTGKPVVVYINDNGDLWQYKGDPSQIDLVSHRSITIQIGSRIDSIPAFSWGTNAQ